MTSSVTEHTNYATFHIFFLLLFSNMVKEVMQINFLDIANKKNYWLPQNMIGYKIKIAFGFAKTMHEMSGSLGLGQEHLLIMQQYFSTQYVQLKAIAFYIPQSAKNSCVKGGIVHIGMSM